MEDYPLGSDWVARIESGIKYLSFENSKLTHYRRDGFLDLPPQIETTAYALASVQIGAWSAIYSELKDIPEIKEASMVFGGDNIDAIIKIESTPERINEIPPIKMKITERSPAIIIAYASPMLIISIMS